MALDAARAIHLQTTSRFWPGDAAFSHARQLGDLRSDNAEAMLVVNNLSTARQQVTIDVRVYAGKVPRDVEDVTWDAVTATPYVVALPPYGYCWLAL